MFGEIVYVQEQNNMARLQCEFCALELCNCEGWNWLSPEYFE